MNPLLALVASALADTGAHAPPPTDEELVLAIPAPTPPPPPPSTWTPPPGWRVVQPPPQAMRTASASVPPGWREVGATRRLPDNRVVEERGVALGGSIGGGTSISADVLIRLNRTTIADLGFGPTLLNDDLDHVSNRLLLGLTWQPGHTTGRHGIFGRVGVGFDTRSDGEPNEGVALAGYAWRLVPHESPMTLEMEVGPGVVYRENGPYGEEWAALAVFARVGGHFWLR